MRITSNLTDEALLQALGQRLAQTRLNFNLTQEQLSLAAGVSKRTVERLEAGEVAIHLSGFVRVLRALQLSDGLDALVPEVAPSPIALLKLREKKRRRARGAPSAATKKWTWDDKPS